MLSERAPRPHRARARRAGAGLTPLAVPVAAVAAGAAALLAWRTRSLTSGGALAAWAIGAAVLAGTGWAGGAVLAAFFVSSSGLGRLAPEPAGLDPKGERRDARQVGANGGPAALGALLGLHDPSLGLWILTGSLAAAAADTWATSIGGWSRTLPRRLLVGVEVARGTSGGMTIAGTLGAAAGALLVAATGAAGGGAAVLLPVGTLIGFAGMVADSALGSGWQGRFYCPVCERASEWPRHRCGARTVQVGGVSWLDNDGVNLAATALGAALAGAAWLCWSR
ncbi:MAG: DUF92 domain-containing protein [Gemmatimonadales bacterium]